MKLRILVVDYGSLGIDKQMEILQYWNEDSQAWFMVPKKFMTLDQAIRESLADLEKACPGSTVKQND